MRVLRHRKQSHPLPMAEGKTAPQSKPLIAILTMKSFRSLLIAAAACLLIPASAEAGCPTRVTRDHCGNTLYWEYAYAGRDWHGCPRYDWVVVRRVCPPPAPVCRPVPSWRGSYGGHGGHYGGSYAPRYDVGSARGSRSRGSAFADPYGRDPYGVRR